MGPTENGIQGYELSDHARYEMDRRGIGRDLVREVLANPEQTFEVQHGRIVAQSRVTTGEGIFLLRVFVDIDRVRPVIVTAYMTSKIAKYWRDES